MASFDSEAFSMDAFSGDSFDFISEGPTITPNGKVIIRVNAVTTGSRVNAVNAITRINGNQKITRVK